MGSPAAGSRARRARVLLALSSFAFVQGLTHSGLTAATLSSITRRYGFSNVQAGFLLAGYDFAAAVAGTVIALAIAAAQRRRRPHADARGIRDEDAGTRMAAEEESRANRDLGDSNPSISFEDGEGPQIKEAVLTVGLALFALGSFMYGAPQLAHGTYGVPEQTVHTCSPSAQLGLAPAPAPAPAPTPVAVGVNASGNATSNGGDVNEEQCDNVITSGGELYALFMVAQIILGIGASPLFTVGPSFIDDVYEGSASVNTALGLFFGASALGPAVGFVLGGITLATWIDGDSAQPPGIQQESRFWVGQWFVGFWISAVAGAALLLPFALALFIGRRRGAPQDNTVAPEENGIELPPSLYSSAATADPESLEALARNGVSASVHVNGAAEHDREDDDDATRANPLGRQTNGDEQDAAHIDTNGGDEGSARAGGGAEQIDRRGQQQPQSDDGSGDHAGGRPGLVSGTFIALIAALSFEVLGKSAIVPFVPLVVQETFGVSSSSASYMVGVVLVPAAILGTIAGGVLVMKTKMSIRSQIMLCAVTVFLGACVFTAASFTMVACDELDFAGINAPAASDSANGTHVGLWPHLPHFGSLFGNRTKPGDERFEDTCNAGCDCEIEYQPVCSTTDGTTYLNGCVAGCENATANDEGVPTAYSNCTCAPSDGRDAVVPGECSRTCAALYGFLSLLFVAIFLVFLNASPVMKVFMECAGAPHTRTLSLALGALAYRLFGAIPGPVLEGLLLDDACRYESPCSNACLVHDPHGVRVAITSFPLSAMGMSAILYVVAWRLHGMKRRLDVGCLIVGAGCVIGILASLRSLFRWKRRRVIPHEGDAEQLIQGAGGASSERDPEFAGADVSEA